MKDKYLFSKQKEFLNKLKKIIPSNFSLVETIAQVLGLSIDSVYRRIRGETALTFEEAIKLCEYFNLSIDTMIDYKEGSVTFCYTPVSNKIDSLKKYLINIYNDLIESMKYENRKIIYISEDIPIFHLFNYRELASFKLFYWLRSILNIPELQNKTFNNQIIDEEIIFYGERMLEEYNKITSIEIWTEHTLNSLIKQIKFYYEAGLLEKGSISNLLCDQLEDLVRSVTYKAEKNSKIKGSSQQNYSIYYSEVEVGNNCIFISLNDFKKVYLTFNTFNIMSTINQKFCEETISWINCILGKSNLVSGISEKQRLMFLNKIIEQINNLRRSL